MLPQQFRYLDPVEETNFRKWARDNYKVGDEINSTHHPVIQHECATMNLEAYKIYHAEKVVNDYKPLL